MRLSIDTKGTSFSQSSLQEKKALCILGAALFLIYKRTCTYHLQIASCLMAREKLNSLQNKKKEKKM